MVDRVAFSREYWRVADATCTLASVDGLLEVNLTDERGLVALWPCQDYFEASKLAFEWRAQRPERWPADSCLDQALSFQRARQRIHVVDHALQRCGIIGSCLNH